MSRIAAMIPILALTAAFAAPAQAEKTVDIVGKDSLKFSVEQITVEPGESVTVKLSNDTTMPAQAMSHNWVLLTAQADPQAFNSAAMTARDNDYIPADKSGQIIAHTEMLAGGKSDTVTFKAPSKPGEYPYICTFPGHFAAGMKGTLIVKGD